MNTSQNLTIFYHSKIEKAVGATILSIILLLAFLGNLLTSLIFLRKPRLRTPTNISILFLSLSDILMAALVMPFSLASLIKGKWISSQEACAFSAWLMNVLLAVSLITMTCTAVIRYFCVVKSAFYLQLVKSKIVAVGVALLWLTYSLFSALAMIFASKGSVYDRRRIFCENIFSGNVADIFNYAGSSLMVISGLVIFLAYFIVFRFVSHHNQTVGSNLQQGNSSHIEEAKITKTLVIVVLGFSSCWAPAITIHLIYIFGGYQHDGQFRMPAFAILLQTLFIFAISCINPFIYGFTNRRFRKEYLELLRLLLPPKIVPAGGL